MWMPRSADLKRWSVMAVSDDFSVNYWLLWLPKVALFLADLASVFENYKPAECRLLLCYQNTTLNSQSSKLSIQTAYTHVRDKQREANWEKQENGIPK